MAASSPDSVLPDSVLSKSVVSDSVGASIAVKVPATTANVGPGFDCLGAALTLYNTFRFTSLAGMVAPDTVEIAVTGLERDRLLADAKEPNAKSDPKNNLAYIAFLKVFEHLGQTPPPVRIDIELGVPLSRGLGSSATAIVGGLMGANALAGLALSPDVLTALAIALEGHPDNVVPALLGGCRLAAADSATPATWQICDIPWHPTVVPVVAIPDFELSTQAARRVLPADYSRADAIFNTAHLGLLLRGLETGNPDWLQAALQDRIHQPYRQALIPGFEAVRTGAIAAGAYEVVISGAGPTLLALTTAAQATAVGIAMQTAWQSCGITATVHTLHLDTHGATLA
jgi:homoserine kinase